MYEGKFVYYSPYDIIISRKPLYVMYIQSIIHTQYFLDFEYINPQCTYQYICPRIAWDRSYMEDTDTFKLRMNVQQNINLPESIDADGSPITVQAINQESGVVKSRIVCDVDAYLVIYSKEGLALRWCKAEKLEDLSSDNYIQFVFKFTTEGYIDNENRIRIETGLYDIGGTNESVAYLDKNVSAKIFIVSKQGDFSYGMGEPNILNCISNIDRDRSVSNIYNVVNGIDFFYDYTDIISSYIKAKREHTIKINDLFGSNYSEDEYFVTTTVPQIQDRINALLDISDKYKWKLDTLITTPVTSMSPGELLDTLREIEYKYRWRLNTYNLVDDEELAYWGGEHTIGENPDDYIDELDDTYLWVSEDEFINDRSIYYHITGIPVVKYGYFSSEERVEEFYDELLTRKRYIDDISLKLEDEFGMDFKFFNTYGPAHWFTWDNGTDTVERINISLHFKLKLKPSYSTNIVNDIKLDVKNYIEDINSIESLHIPNLITYITTKYRTFLVYFEFVSINNRVADYQHLYSMPVPNGLIVPEFVNIYTLEDGSPDINIEVV